MRGSGGAGNKIKEGTNEDGGCVADDGPNNLEVLRGDSAEAAVHGAQEWAMKKKNFDAVRVVDVHGQLVRRRAEDALARLQRWVEWLSQRGSDSRSKTRLQKRHLRALLHVEKGRQLLDDVVLVFDIELQRLGHHFVSEERGRARRGR